jgi:hypothetical protein
MIERRPIIDPPNASNGAGRCTASVMGALFGVHPYTTALASLPKNAALSWRC